MCVRVNDCTPASCAIRAASAAVECAVSSARWRSASTHRALVDQQRRPLRQFRERRTPPRISRKHHGALARFHRATPSRRRCGQRERTWPARLGDNCTHSPGSAGRCSVNTQPAIPPPHSRPCPRSSPRCRIGQQRADVRHVASLRAVHLHGLLGGIAPAALHLDVRQPLAVVGMAVAQQAVVIVSGRYAQLLTMAQHGVAGRRVQQDALAPWGSPAPSPCGSAWWSRRSRFPDS